MDGVTVGGARQCRRERCLLGPGRPSGGLREECVETWAPARRSTGRDLGPARSSGPSDALQVVCESMPTAHRRAAPHVYLDRRPTSRTGRLRRAAGQGRSDRSSASRAGAPARGPVRRGRTGADETRARMFLASRAHCEGVNHRPRAAGRPGPSRHPARRQPARDFRALPPLRSSASETSSSSPPRQRPSSASAPSPPNRSRSAS